MNAIYQASLLHCDVLEIGGGLGRTAYYAVRRRVRSYTIVDLPFTGISQGYFLAKTLGRDHGVRLLSPDEFLASSACYDVALNVDSMTELNRTMAQRYADTVRARARIHLHQPRVKPFYRARAIRSRAEVAPSVLAASRLRGRDVAIRTAGRVSH